VICPSCRDCNSAPPNGEEIGQRFAERRLNKVAPLGHLSFAIFETRISTYSKFKLCLRHRRFRQLTIDIVHTDIWRLPMNALSSVYTPAARTYALPLKTIALFFGLVLGSFLCAATYGLDLSPGLF
jgi:hypothetical protein